MNARSILMLGIALLCLGVPLAGAGNVDDDTRYMTLNGLSSLAVTVDGLRDNLSSYGLTPATMQERAVAGLRAEGVDVIPTSELPTMPDAALMRVKVTLNENQYRFYFYGITLEIRKKISLNNAAGGYITETIWQRGETGIAMPTELRKLYDVVDTLLGEFVRDYRAQNPVSSADPR